MFSLLLSYILSHRAYYRNGALTCRHLRVATRTRLLRRLLRLPRRPRRPRVKPTTRGLSWIWGGGLDRFNSFMRGLELLR